MDLHGLVDFFAPDNPKRPRLEDCFLTKDTSTMTGAATPEIAVPHPQFVKTDYYHLSELAEVGVGVINTYVKVFLRKRSPINKELPSQSISYIVREWDTLKTMFPLIDLFFIKEDPEILSQTYIVNTDKFIKVERNGSVSKIAFKRKVAERNKGVSLSLEEFESMKDTATKIDARIRELTAQHPDNLRIEKLKDIARIVIQSKMEKLWEFPETFCKHHYEKPHQCACPTERDYQTIVTHYDALYAAINIKATVLLSVALAAYMGIKTSASESELIVNRILRQDKDLLASALFNENTSSNSYPVRQAFRELFDRIFCP